MGPEGFLSVQEARRAVPNGQVGKILPGLFLGLVGQNRGLGGRLENQPHDREGHRSVQEARRREFQDRVGDPARHRDGPGKPSLWGWPVSGNHILSQSHFIASMKYL